MRLIDAEQLLEDIGDYHWSNEFLVRLVNRQKTIKPTLEDVPVILCKDCKHMEEEFFPNGGFKGYVCRNPYMGLEGIELIQDDDYCSYAERRDAYNGET